MSEAEQLSGNSPDSETQISTVGEGRKVDIFISAKYFGVLSTCLSVLAGAESVAGLEEASMSTIRFAGSAAVGAACGAIGGFFLKDR